MDKFNQFYSKRFFMILFLICLFFFVVIIKAFEIAMNNEISEKANKKEVVEQINVNSSDKEENKEVAEEINAEEQEEVSEETEIKVQEKTQNKKMKKIRNFEEMDEISEIDEPVAIEKTGVNTENIEDVYKFFAKAREYKLNKSFNESIQELEKVANITTDKEMIAKSYEEIANIYAIQRRYGSAMTFAQKAYSLNPTSSREFLIARICYKTGNTDRATSKIESILKKDFVVD